MTERTSMDVLNLLAEGKISAGEAAVLLQRTPDAPEATVDEVADSIAVGDPADVGELKASEAEALKAFAEFESEASGADGIDESKDVVYSPAHDIEYEDDGQKPRWLRIRVKDLDTGRQRVTVNLPIRLVSFSLFMAERFGANRMDGFDAQMLRDMLVSGKRGVLVDVQDDEDNQHVVIYLD